MDLLTYVGGVVQWICSPVALRGSSRTGECASRCVHDDRPFIVLTETKPTLTALRRLRVVCLRAKESAFKSVSGACQQAVKLAMG
jgi:hypothetical protein